MTQQIPNLTELERGWGRLMKLLGKTLPNHANRNRILLNVLNSRMGRR